MGHDWDVSAPIPSPSDEPAAIRLQHVGVTFPPGREADLRDFYGELIGLTEMPLPPAIADRPWIWFATRDPGIELHFISDETPPDPTRRHHFCLQVNDLAALRAKLEARGAETREPSSRIPGRMRLFTRDPVGNLVELVEMPSDASSPPSP